MRFLTTTLPAASAAVFLACLAGCGSGSADATLLGRVTLDGQPLSSGQVRLVPIDGSSTTVGAIITAGEFALTAPPGSYRVEINSAKAVGQQKMYDTADSPSVSVVEELLPARYNSRTELKAELQAGEQPQHFELSSK